MTTTTPSPPPTPAAPRSGKGSTANTPIAVRFPRLLAFAVGCLAACLLLWGGLFLAFGTANGEGHTARTLKATFDRSSASTLGSPERGPRWSTVGTWEATGGQASVLRPAAGGWSAAVSDLGARDVRISAVATHVSIGWGLVFRYHDARNFWYLMAEQGAALHLGVVVDGRASDVAAVSALLVEGSRPEVRVDDHDVEVRLDGRFVVSVRDDRMQADTRVGLLLHGGDTSARWDEVTGGPLPDPTVVMPPGQP